MIYNIANGGVRTFSVEKLLGADYFAALDLPYPRDDLDPRFAAIVRSLEADIEREAAGQWDEI